MRVELRRLRAGEVDQELIWLVVSVSAAAAGIAWLALHLPWPACTFRSLTGLPCLTCGAARSASAFLHGDLGSAWKLNPLIFFGICGIILFDVYAIGVLSSGARRVRVVFPKRMRKITLTLTGAVGLLNWLYLLQRGT